MSESGASQVALMVKNPPANAGDQRDAGSIPWVGNILWRRARQLTPVFLPGNPMDRGAWRAIVHGVSESDSTEATKQQQ